MELRLYVAADRPGTGPGDDGADAILVLDADGLVDFQGDQPGMIRARGGTEASRLLQVMQTAPALLAACEECAEWLDLCKQNYPDMAGLIRGLESARAAIAQAKPSAAGR